MKKWEKPEVLNLALNNTNNVCKSRAVAPAAWVPVSWGCNKCGYVYCQETAPTGPCINCKENAGYTVKCNDWVS